MATARDVARRAGVSTSTVSHVANGTRVVSEELRVRVLEAMHELGYETNAVARSLKTRRSHTIALVISDIANPFFAAVTRGAEDVLLARGYTLILGHSREDPAREEAYLRLLGAQRVDGLIIAPAGYRHPYLDRILDRQAPLVLIDRALPGATVPTVMLDNVDAARVATRHLIGLGHRRIGMIIGRPGISTTVDRLAGYRAELSAAGLPDDPELVVEGGSLVDGGREATTRLLGLRRPPSALVVGNNLMTLGAMMAAKACEVPIPEGLAIVGFDDPAWAAAMDPPITAIAQPAHEMGRLAAELVMRRIEDPGVQLPERTVVSGRLVVRGSCGAMVLTAPRAPAG